MKLRHLAPFLAILAGVGSAQDLNRLQLHNGGEVPTYLQDPYGGAPVSNFDPTGDLYWKCYPADALRRCSGYANLMGHEASVYDEDFFTGEVLWAYTITESSTGTDGTCIPIFTGAGVFVPGVSVSGLGVGGPGIFGSPGCPPPGSVAGWLYTDTFINTGTGLATPLIALPADGAMDWTFTHFFPAPGPFNTQSLSDPLTNSCGHVGDATFQWLRSIDGFGPTFNGGENQPDWTGFGNSIYGGYSIGGDGIFAPMPEENDGGADHSWFFDEMTVQFNVDTDNGDGFPGPEFGLAALETPLQVNSGGVFAGGTTRIGLTGFDSEANSFGFSAFIQMFNIGPNLLQLGIGCLPFGNGGLLAMNPTDPAFQPSIAIGGMNPYFLDSNGEIRADADLAPLGIGPAWPSLELTAQGHTLDLVFLTLASSNVTATTFRFNDGL